MGAAVPRPSDRFLGRGAGSAAPPLTSPVAWMPARSGVLKNSRRFPARHQVPGTPPAGPPRSFGVAYRVYDTIRSVDRAVKLVLRDRGLRRWSGCQREADVLQRLRARRTPTWCPWSTRTGCPHPIEYPYLVFEFVDGKDVAEVIRGGRMGAADVLRLALDTARGLRHIHDLGVWHCDIKPSNLLWTDDGVKLHRLRYREDRRLLRGTHLHEPALHPARPGPGAGQRHRIHQP